MQKANDLRKDFAQFDGAVFHRGHSPGIIGFEKFPEVTTIGYIRRAVVPRVEGSNVGSTGEVGGYADTLQWSILVGCTIGLLVTVIVLLLMRNR